MRKSQNFWDRNAGRYDCFMLKDAGILVAPTFTHADNGFSGKIKAFFMKLAGFPLRSKWVISGIPAGKRLDSAKKHRGEVSFPLTYAECMKSEET